MLSADHISIPQGKDKPRAKTSKHRHIVFGGPLLSVVASLMLVAWAGQSQAARFVGSVDVLENGTDISRVETPTLGGADTAQSSEVVTHPGAFSANTSNSTEVEYRSSQQTSSTGGGNSNASAVSLTINGQSVPVSQDGSTQRVVESHSNGSGSTVFISIDSSSSGGQSGGGN